MRKLWHAFLCRISDCVVTFFHEVEVIETYDAQTRKLQCRWCGGYFADSDRYKAVWPWDEEYEQIICMIYGLPRTKL